MAVNNISFTIEPGEIFGLLGPNGAGKSTTINMIAGVTRVGSGSIEIFGFDNQSDSRITRRLVGVMHQEIVIDNFFTIDQALRLHAGYYGVRDDAAWRQRLIDRLGLKPHLHKVMIKLSGGMKRRFMIAKALIHKPRLLILDEPTAGVDVELRHTLWDFVREINQQGTTILLTTHYLEEAEQMCDRIAIMNHGDLIALETTSTLLKELGTRSMLVHLQTPIKELPANLCCQAVDLDDTGTTLRLTLSASQSTGELLKHLCDINLPIADIETRKASLEEIFLQMTQAGRVKP
ncbi:MAG: ABC transporter ATP-binding protein [Desulfuromonadales bacterium]